MEYQNDIAIIILAAGESTRMGTPKQLLPWKNKTLLAHTIELAKKIRPKDIFVVLGANSERIGPTISDTELFIVKNPSWQEGMGSSIACGVEHVISKKKEYHGVLILLCDQPLISQEYLNLLIHTFITNEKRIVATNYGKRAGVPVIFGKKNFPALTKLEGDNGAKTIINKNIYDTIVINSGENLTDLDTKVEYERLLKKFKN